MGNNATWLHKIVACLAHIKVKHLKDLERSRLCEDFGKFPNVDRNHVGPKLSGHPIRLARGRF